MGLWFLIGFLYGVFAAIIKKSDHHDEQWMEILGCTLLGPICFLWLASAIAQDLIYKKKVKK